MTAYDILLVRYNAEMHFELPVIPQSMIPPTFVLFSTLVKKPHVIVQELRIAFCLPI